MSKPSFWSKPTMPNNHDKPIGAPQLQQPKKLETLNRFPAENDLSGTATLPTPMPPYGPHIGELNDVTWILGWFAASVFMASDIGRTAQCFMVAFCSHYWRLLGFFWV
jgi:hypothetical protein